MTRAPETGAELVAEGVVGRTGSARPARIREHDYDRRRRAERLARRPANPHGDRPASPAQPQIGGPADAGRGERVDPVAGCWVSRAWRHRHPASPGRESPIAHHRVAAFASRARAQSRIIDLWPIERKTEAANVLAFPQAPDAIELRHLRAFVAVAEELSFSRAADRLHISQSALSRQVSSLEKLIGCDLLRRSTHRVELTLAGEALLERTHSLLEGVDEAVADDPVGGRRARLPPRPVLGAGVRQRRSPGSRSPSVAPRSRGCSPSSRRPTGSRSSRSTPAASPRFGSAPTSAVPGDRPLPARRRPHLRLLLRPPRRDRRRRRGRERDRARARVPARRPSIRSPPTSRMRSAPTGGWSRAGSTRAGS